MAYLILTWPGRPRPGSYDTVLARASDQGLVVAHSGLSWTLLADGRERVAAFGHDGLVLGDLFRRDGHRADPERIGWSPGASVEGFGSDLARDYWGRYLVLVAGEDGGELRFFRDPSGGVQCLCAKGGGYDVVASDMAAGVGLGLIQPEIDWAYVGHHVAYNGARSQRTGLVGVNELLPGQVLTVSDKKLETASYWRPADVLRHKPFSEPRQAAEALFSAIERTVGALASVESSIVVELSGGLDSSIIAMALRRRARTYAVNCATHGPEGDERAYARQVAEAAGIPLTEHELNPADIDFTRPPTPWMARPGRTTVLQSVDAVFGEAGRSLAASAFFNGTGGDSVFFYTQSAAPATDRLFAEGPGMGFFETVGDVADLTGASVWRAGHAAIKLALKGRSAYQPSGHPELVAERFRPDEPDPHPWLEGLETASPGRLRHIRGIVAVHGHVDGHDRNQLAPVIAAHGGQLVLEAVLKTPTWMWVAQGRDRAIAREAYARLLPRDIYNRRSKGRINRFITEAYEANRSVIRTVLHDGVLARQRVIDLAAVDKILAAPLVLDATAFMGLIRLVDVELWAQGWTRATA
jgi:asparagine synthase (glutamine-hydrolysing)